MGVVTSTSEAQAAKFNLEFTGFFNPITGTGTVTIDDSLLTPDNSTDGLTGFTAFEATLTNLPTLPNSTTFNLGDVLAFVLVTATGSIVDFKLLDAGNADGFKALGVSPNTFALLQNGDFVGDIGINITPVPEPLTILGAGTAIAFGGAFKRKLAKKNKK